MWDGDRLIVSETNYQSKYWGYIYDQLMRQASHQLLDENLAFYQSNLGDVKGRVLDCACGTGLFLLPLIAQGHDVYGYDISKAMLSTLKKKALAQGVVDIDARISVQALESFVYDIRFDAAIIPTNTFVMLTTQDAQIATLKNIHAHLAPGGRLLLDLRLADMRDLVENADGIRGNWHTWVHPETGRPIRQRVIDTRDFTDQLVLDRCFIEYDDDAQEFPMTSRWIFKDEFQLLLRLAGFERWDVFGTPEGAPLVVTPEESRSFWIAYKGY